ncbi:MGMT family protein [Rothia sp. ZJ932]|uniref:MGMT family protein n=1 Tax=Rothia sp. ZJ932 TaxID=2810516 RepID=UPI0019670D36|nr:MGMT family protein [Rothia sp. ZJ932]QRZ61139.1 MGMT family protein [Rothia sp. ZJ932]
MDETRVERILRAVECIPASEVATYGDLGKITDESPRVIGRVMATWGSNVPWWRVVNAKGQISGHFAQALPHWQAEDITVKEEAGAVALNKHRTELSVLQVAWYQAVADLTESSYCR